MSNESMFGSIFGGAKIDSRSVKLIMTCWFI